MDRWMRAGTGWSLRSELREIGMTRRMWGASSASRPRTTLAVYGYGERLDGMGRARQGSAMRLEVIPWTAADPPAEMDLKGRLAADGFGDAFAWTDAPGAHYAAHSHDHDESIWVIAGEVTFGAGGRALRLGPGDRLMLPANTVHTADAGPDGATYLIGERQ